MSSKKTSGKKSSSAKKTSSARKTSSSSSSRSRSRSDDEQGRGGTGTAGARSAQSPKDTGPGADIETDGSDQFHSTHGRYRDEVVESGDPADSNFRVRRTFLASKTEFEVEVPKAGVVGITQTMTRHNRDKLIKAAAKVALDLRTKQLDTELDNSDLGGKSIAQAVGGGTYNPENKYAPRPSQGQEAAGSDGGSAPGSQTGETGGAAEEPTKGQGAPTTADGQPVTDAKIAGSPNDRTATAGTSKSAQTVADASGGSASS